MQATLNYNELTKTHCQTKTVSLQSYVVPIAAVCICLFTRLLYFGRYIDEWDSVNFGFGLFFVITSVLLFYMAVKGIHETSKSCPNHENDKYKTSLVCFALGGAVLGLGVRVTYLALIPTTDDYRERFFDIFHNLSAHSLGAWWTDTPFLRIIPTIIIVLAFVCFFFHEKWNFKNRFLLAFFIPYFLWIAFIQDAIRQIMVLIPFLIIIMSAGLIHGFTHYAKDRKWGFSLFFAVVFTIIVTQVVDSLRIVFH